MQATIFPLALLLGLGACAASPTGAPAALGEPSHEYGLAERSADEATVDGPALDTFVALEQDGVRGGALSVRLAGTVDQVFDALLDFDAADGHRSWAETFELLDAEADQLGPRRVARWNFRGKLGVKPSVTLEFRPVRTTEGARISFRLIESALGLRTFEGAYELSPSADGSTRFTQRVFMSSGLAFVDATHADIAAGLQNDAQRLAAWLAARTALRGLESPTS